MPEVPEGWGALVDDLTDWVSPEWTRNARDFGSQPWIRLILLVDAHAALCNAQATEKIAMTMADLATDERAQEREGWEAISAAARDKRMAVVASIVDRAESLLPEEHLTFFARSIEPMSHMNMP